MKKSPLLIAVPNGVLTEIRPDVPPGGAVVAMSVDVAEDTVATPTLKTTTLSACVVWKLVPLTVTGVPGVPMVGVNPVMVGPAQLTENGVLLAAEPVAVVTVIGPALTPAGAETMSCVEAAEVTVPTMPLKVTVFSLGVVLNPVPEMVTEVPEAPQPGVKVRIETWAELWRPIERRLPTAS